MTSKIDNLFQNFGIGITGGIATGKSTVTKILRDCHFFVGDADQLAREVVQPGTNAYQKIVQEFGKDILAPNRNIDRKILGKIIFNSQKLKKKLEEIVHPEIYCALTLCLEKKGLIDNPSLWFYDAALLFESNRYKEFYKIWTTFCPKEIQIERIKKRNPENYQTLVKAIDQQMSLEHKKLLSDEIIDTNVPMEILKTTVKNLANSEGQNLSN